MKYIQKDNPYKDTLKDSDEYKYEVKTKLSILDIINEESNVAKLLPEEDLDAVGQCVLRGLKEDEESMQSWLDYANRSMELTKIERETKQNPFRNASNVKYPLITTAVMQWASRAVSEFIKDGKVAHIKIIGNDPTGAKSRKGDRIKKYLNWKILDRMPNWLDQRDKLHSQLAVVGTSFTKTWFDTVTGMNRSELIPYDCLIVNNQIKAFDEAPRVSEYRKFSENELIEHVRANLFLELNFCALTKDKNDSKAILHSIIEQHCWYDFDQDGYEEPYIVTVHESSGKVLRIIPRYRIEDIFYVDDDQSKPIRRIKARQYYSDYHFLPSPDGHMFFSFGFGTLLLDANESVNTIVNQLINAGHLATVQGGLIGKNLRIRKEDMYVDPGEWIVAESASGTDLKDEIVPFNYKEPSNVLYQLLGMLIESSQALTSTTDVLLGTADTTNASPNTVLALLQQGLKVYSAIARRVARGTKKELQILFDLFSENLNEAEYLAVIDPTKEEASEMYNQFGQISDFDQSTFDVVPVVDQNMSTEAERLAREQAAFQANLQFIQVGAINPRVAARNFHQSLETPNIDQLITPEPPPNAPNPQMIELQSQLDLRSKQIEFKAKELQIKDKETAAKIEKLHADTLKALKDVETSDSETKLNVYREAFNQLIEQVNANLEVQKLDIERQKNAIAAKKTTST